MFFARDEQPRARGGAGRRGGAVAEAVDPSDVGLSEPVDPSAEADEPVRLDVGVAVAVTVAAAFLTLCCVQAATTVRTMSNLEVQIVEASSLVDSELPDAALAVAADEAARAARVARWERRRVDSAARAKELTADYDRLAGDSRQLDVAEIVLSFAIVLFGLTALSQRRWVFGVGVACAVFGLAMGGLGLLGVHVESAWLLRLARL
jgi:hypothetical protein